jgi:hypothetical protein
MDQFHKFAMLVLFCLAGQDLLANDYFYLRDVKQCLIKKYNNGSLEIIPKENLVNIPITVKQLDKSPNYVTFQIKRQVYIASTDCLYLATENHPEVQDRLRDDSAIIGENVDRQAKIDIHENEFEKYFLEVGGGVTNIRDQNQVAADYNVLIKPIAGNPIIWSDATPSAYKTKLLYGLGFGIEKFDNGFLAFKIRGFSGSKTDSVSVLNVNSGITLLGDWYYSETIVNYYAGYKRIFQTNGTWIPTIAAYIGLSTGKTVLSNGSNNYSFSSMGITGLVDIGLEYMVTKTYGIGINFGYEYIGTRTLSPVDKTGTVTTSRTRLNYNNTSGTLGLKSYF